MHCEALRICCAALTPEEKDENGVWHAVVIIPSFLASSTLLAVAAIVWKMCRRGRDAEREPIVLLEGRCSRARREAKVDGNLGGSDHELVEFRILTQGRKVSSRIRTLDFRKADFDSLRERMARIPWGTNLKGKGVQESWLYFKESLLRLQGQTIPMSRKNSKYGRRPAWLNGEILADLKHKKEAYKKWKVGHMTREEYKNIARACRNVIRRAKSHLELQLARDVKSNKKGFFRYVGNKKKAKESVGPLLNEGGNLVTEDVEKANTAALGITKWGRDGQPSVEIEVVRDYLEKLDVHKSMGPDELHLRVLKELAAVIAEPLAIIFENSWRTGEVPDDWKKANVVPIFKKEKKEDPGNYRLVSLTSVPGKIMEQVLKESILKHLHERKVIRNSQHGFTKGRSCLTNLITFYDEITGSVDEGKAVDVLCLDFSKAFDTVSHSILVSKLKKYGLDECTISPQEMKDFIEVMKFHIKICKHDSLVKVLWCQSQALPLCLILEAMSLGNLLHFLWQAHQGDLPDKGRVYELTEKSVFTMAIQIARGLEYLTASQKLIHGDAAARNVLIHQDMTVRLCGLGLAGEVYCRGMLPSRKAAEVSIKWLPPERILKHPVTAKGDVVMGVSPVTEPSNNDLPPKRARRAQFGAMELPAWEAEIGLR
ncbi:unnamed protein product [Lepidochelys kempii]